MISPRHSQIRVDEISIYHPTELNKLGDGAFGVVYKGKCRGKDVAVKILHKPITDFEILNSFIHEVDMMSKVSHPNICLFMGACTNPQLFFIVQEFMPRGDVEKLLRSDQPIALSRRIKMAKDAALGVNWLHLSDPVFIHRDLKSSNLLIDENWNVKVCDFGLSQVKTQAYIRDDQNARGTPLWMAPEVMLFKDFDEKVDVYSFGIVLWELLTRKEPFERYKTYEELRDAVCYKHERPVIPPDTEKDLVALITSCWDPVANRRPNFTNILRWMDPIFVDVSISDPIGRQMWKQNFLLKDKVSWREFERALITTLALPMDPIHEEDIQKNMKCLKALLVPTPPRTQPPTIVEELVTIDNWEKILNLFGPIGDINTTAKNKTFLDDIRKIMEEKWFHGDTDLQRSQELLSSKPLGTFMIRFSSVPGYFTLSQLQPGPTVEHKRIAHSPGSPYVIDREEYATLFELVEGKRLVLPCEGSKYTIEVPSNPYPENPYVY